MTKKKKVAAPSYEGQISLMVTPEARARFQYRVVSGRGVSTHLRVLDSTPLDALLLHDLITPDEHATGVKIEALLNGCRAFASGAPLEAGGGGGGSDGLTWGRAHHMDRLVKLAAAINSYGGRGAYNEVMNLFLGGKQSSVAALRVGLRIASEFFSGSVRRRPSALDAFK